MFVYLSGAKVSKGTNRYLGISEYTCVLFHPPITGGIYKVLDGTQEGVGFFSLVLDLGAYSNSPVLVSSFRRLHLRVKVHGDGATVSIQVLAWIRFAIEA